VRIVITGASSGIGRAAALALAKQGHDVTVIGRDPARTAEVARLTGGDSFVADFDRIAEVRELATKLRDAYPIIDALANNAGGIIGTRGLSADGIERTWQHNVLAPFVLTNLLLDRLVDSDARVIFTGSNASRWAKVDLDDLQLETRSWRRGLTAYGQAKRADMMLARELPRRADLTAYSFHPGPVATRFGGLDSGPFAPIIARVIRTPEKGAGAMIRLLNGRLSGPNGTYFIDDKRDRGLPRQAADPAEGARLWAALEEQVSRIP